MIYNIPAAPGEPLFLVREGSYRFPLTHRQVGQLLKQWCELAGLDAKSYMTHCLRKGGLSFAHHAKLTGESLQILGDWASHAYLCYIDIDFQSHVESGK